MDYPSRSAVFFHGEGQDLAKSRNDLQVHENHLVVLPGHEVADEVAGGLHHRPRRPHLEHLRGQLQSAAPSEFDVDGVGKSGLRSEVPKSSQKWLCQCFPKMDEI